MKVNKATLTTSLFVGFLAFLVVLQTALNNDLFTKDAREVVAVLLGAVVAGAIAFTSHVLEGKGNKTP